MKILKLLFGWQCSLISRCIPSVAACISEGHAFVPEPLKWQAWPREERVERTEQYLTSSVSYLCSPVIFGVPVEGPTSRGHRESYDPLSILKESDVFVCLFVCLDPLYLYWSSSYSSHGPQVFNIIFHIKNTNNNPTVHSWLTVNNTNTTAHGRANDSTLV